MNDNTPIKLCPGCGESLNEAGKKKHHNAACRLRAFQIRRVKNLFSVMEEMAVAIIRKKGFRF